MVGKRILAAAAAAVAGKGIQHWPDRLHNVDYPKNAGTMHAGTDTRLLHGKHGRALAATCFQMLEFAFQHSSGVIQGVALKNYNVYLLAHTHQ